MEVLENLDMFIKDYCISQEKESLSFGKIKVFINNYQNYLKISNGKTNLIIGDDVSDDSRLVEEVNLLNSLYNIIDSRKKAWEEVRDILLGRESFEFITQSGCIIQVVKTDTAVEVYSKRASLSFSNKYQKIPYTDEEQYNLCKMIVLFADKIINEPEIVNFLSGQINYNIKKICRTKELPEFLYRVNYTLNPDEENISSCVLNRDDDLFFIDTDRKVLMAHSGGEIEEVKLKKMSVPQLNYFIDLFRV